MSKRTPLRIAIDSGGTFTDCVWLQDATLRILKVFSTPADPAEAIAAAAAEQNVHVVGLSILSGSHLSLVREVIARLDAAGLTEVPVVVGGIIPPQDAEALREAGVAAIYTPKDFELNHILSDVVRIVQQKCQTAIK